MKKFQFSRLKKRLRKVDKQDDTLYIFSFWVRVGIMMVRKWLPINFNGWGSESSENFSNLLTIKSSVSTLLQLCCLPHHGHWYSYFILITKYPLCINRKRTLTKTKLKQKHFKIGPLAPSSKNSPGGNVHAHHLFFYLLCKQNHAYWGRVEEMMRPVVVQTTWFSKGPPSPKYSHSREAQR